MSGSRPSSPSRPMGGHNPGIGSFGEGMDEAALQQMMQGSGSTPGGAQPPAGMPPGAQPPPAPREIGSFKDELLVRPARDVAAGLGSLFNLADALGINIETDSPETQAKKKQMLEKFNSMGEEEQHIAQQEYQQRMAQKQHQEEEAAARKHQLEQQRAQTLSVPTSPQKGAQNPGGSKKQQAAQRLDQDRKTLGGPKSVN